jgi:FkbM family methyltransferase
MLRTKEIAFRAANAALISGISLLHRSFGVDATYKIGAGKACAEFEGCWFAYHPAEFGCTGNLDFYPEAENKTRHALFEMVMPGQVFYDIGAHGGVYSITLQKRFPALKIHSFEPQPEDLLANLALNDMQADNVHAVAVGERAGTVAMTTKHRSSNHVSEAGDRSVPMVTLDQYVAERNLPPPDWIKIDIEGLELPALRGAKSLLAAHHPNIICEINHLYGRFGTKLADFMSFLDSLGYDVFKLAQDGFSRVAKSDNLADLGYSADNNFWFVHRDRSGHLAAPVDRAERSGTI